MTTTKFDLAREHHGHVPWGGFSLSLWAFVALFSFSIHAAMAEDALDRRIQLDIPANTRLEDALIEWGTHARMTVMINTSTVYRRLTDGIRGTFSARDALTTLLRNSGLSYTAEAGRVRVIPADALVRSRLRTGSPTPADDSTPQLDADRPVSSPMEDANSPAAHHRELEEVVVTAEKREERLQDVPVPVTSIDAHSLTDINQVSLIQYASSISSLNYTPVDPSGGVFTIRGLNSGGGSSTVAVMIDGVPFGSTSAIASAVAVPDLDPGVLERIEVLRGPQGTLYGATSIGGLINFITAAPSTDGVSGRVQADLSSTYGGSGPGYGGRGMINIPLTDTLAIRANAFARHEPGYIEDVQTSQNGVNWGNAGGGRLAALWRPSETFSLQLSALLQDSTTHGDPEVFLAPGFSDLQQSILRGTGWAHASSQNYSAILKAKVSIFDVTSISSYNDNYLANSFDNSGIYGPLIQPLPQFGVGSSYIESYGQTKKVTEELRLSTSIGSKIDWMVGGFYTHETSRNMQPDYAADGNTGERAGLFVNYDWSSTYAEYAAFTDLTFKISDQFDIQFGGRESFNKQEYQETDSGPYVPQYVGIPTPAIYPTEHTDQSAFTYLVTPRYKLSPDFMVYARIASGYRPGGPNFNDAGPLAATVPPSFGSDRTKNYEIGVKGDALDRSITFDASVYYVDWNNIQVQLFNQALGVYFLGNAGGAKSQGVELSVDSTPFRWLTLGGWVSFNDAEITRAFPSTSTVYGVPGNILPYAARFSGNFSVQGEFPLGAKLVGFIGGEESYVGERLGTFLGAPPSTFPRQVFPAYAKTDLHAGVRYGNWTGSFFANNVTDRRGILNGGAGTLNPESFYIIPPRTIGLSVSRTF